jgi:hypothetical protein
MDALYIANGFAAYHSPESSGKSPESSGKSPDRMRSSAGSAPSVTFDGGLQEEDDADSNSSSATRVVELEGTPPGPRGALTALHARIGAWLTWMLWG